MFAFFVRLRGQHRAQTPHVTLAQRAAATESAASLNRRLRIPTPPQPVSQPLQHSEPNCLMLRQASPPPLAQPHQLQSQRCRAQSPEERVAHGSIAQLPQPSLDRASKAYTHCRLQPRRSKSACARKQARTHQLAAARGAKHPMLHSPNKSVADFPIMVCSRLGAFPHRRNIVTRAQSAPLMLHGRSKMLLSRSHAI